MNDTLLSIKFREFKDKFNKYRGLTELTRDLEALQGDMSDKEKELLISLLNEEDVSKTKVFKQQLIIRIVNDRSKMQNDRSKPKKERKKK